MKWITAVLKVETDIITSITASLIGQAAILIIMHDVDIENNNRWYKKKNVQITNNYVHYTVLIIWYVDCWTDKLCENLYCCVLGHKVNREDIDGMYRTLKT